MATPAPQGRDEHAARLPVLVALLGVVLQAWRFRELDQAIDDAWITLRVARHWVQTGQPFFNPGVAVEASTSFLWTALSATWVTSWPGDPIGPARWLGLAFHLLAVGVAVGLAGRLAGRWGPGASVARWVAALLLVTPGWLAYHALSGMETGLYALLTVLAVSALARQDEPTAGRASSWWLGVVLALLALVRPEGVLLAALAVGAVWWGGGRPGERWAVLAPVALAVVGMEVFRWLTFGDLVPNTFHAKPPNPVRGAAYLGQYLLWGLGGVGWLAAWPLVRRARVARAVLAGALVLGLGVAWSGGDWMRGFRRCAPISVALVPVAAAGATLARRRLGLALAGAWAVGNLAGTATGHDGERVIITQMAELGRRAAATPGAAKVMLSDMGAFGWYFPGSIIDLYGLADAHIAAEEGTHGRKPWDEAYFRAQAPDLVFVRSFSEVGPTLTAPLVLTANERGLYESLLTDDRYRYHRAFEVARGKVWMLVFARRELPLPEALWGPPAPRQLRDLEHEYRSRPTPARPP